MRLLSVFLSITLFLACTKKKAEVTDGTVSPQAPLIPKPCQFTTITVISYSSMVSQILKKCLPCHEYPGSGGISLDSYSPTQQTALSGQLIRAVSNDPSYVIMPPPPALLLDSCEIKALNLWIRQGCLNN